MGSYVIPAGRMSFPSVFKPRLNALSNKMEYTYDHLFDKNEDLKEFEAKLMEAAIEKHGPKEDWPDKFIWPVKDQGTKVKKKNKKIVKDEKGKPVLLDGYVAGAKFITLKSTKKPQVVNGKLEAITEDSDELYAGCRVRASVSIYAYDNKANGVNAGLVNIQKVADGPRLGGKTSADEDFVAVETDDDENIDDLS